MDKEQLKEKIRQAIENEPLKNDIKKASLFGSCARGDFSVDSDIDILVEFKPAAVIGFFKFAEIKRNLEKFIGKKVDLLTPQALSKFFKEKVLNEAELIYEG